MGNFFVHNGRTLPEGNPVQEMAGSSRLDHGVFETMRLHHGNLLLAEYHFERLSAAMQAMELRVPMLTAAYFQDITRQLFTSNAHRAAARMRLTVFRDGSRDVLQPADFIIESWDLHAAYTFPGHGLNVGLYPGAFKHPDAIAAYKTNYRLYSMAAAYARDHALDECMVWNSAGNICDAAISNVFWIKDGQIGTPPLSEGCIAGVMRRHLLHSLQEKEFQVVEKPLTLELLLDADEVFLTNVIRGIRPVEKFQQVKYGNAFTRKIFESFVRPLNQ
ncbi:MAG TPA: aminotransferase class IV [Chitinophagaceae bacterium]|nr:aminotransferase class IV [Chitinophagaceae bacterium]